jgi:predicted SprT family Zn-dependent metalloprotease
MYELASERVVEMIQEIRREHFMDSTNAKILTFVRHKMKKKHGRLVLADISKPSKREKFFSTFMTDDGQPYDYVIEIDGKIVEHAEEEDLVRVLRHELRHIFVDPEKKDPYKLIDHDFSDFLVEVELNQLDPTWCSRVSRVIMDIYEQEKEDK